MMRRLKIIILALVLLGVISFSIVGCDQEQLPPVATPVTTIIPATPTAVPPTAFPPTQPPMPTAAPTASSTPPSDTPEPTPTPGFEEALVQASLGYLADTTEKADAMARKIGYKGGKNESASLACGPLSIAILQDAGLLSKNINTHDSWLLCAREDNPDCSGMETLQRIYFPPQEYDYLRIRQSVRDYDFVSNPLQPGDWMYLYVTINGFDHMLVVTRVDENGAAYTVTNLDRGFGFEIVEAMLYSPDQPGSGLFYELTDPARGKLGVTGTGGFLLIRRKGGISATPENNPLLGASLLPAAHWNGLVMDIDTRKIYFESLPNEVFHPASMIKVPIAMVALSVAEKLGMSIAELPTTGFGNRTLEQLLTEMLVNSEEDATERLIKFIRTSTSERNILVNWGVNHTFFEPRKTTAYDMAVLLEGLFRKTMLSEASSQYILDLMATQTDNDAKFLGVLQSRIPDSVLYNKRGTLTSPSIIAGDMGILTVGDKVYIIVLAGHPQSAGSITFEELQANIEDFAGILSTILQN